MIDRTAAIDLAYAWSRISTWADPGVALHGFAASGKVQSESHRALCLAYLQKECRARADAAGHKELDALAAYIVAAPIEPV